jgi:uncharacterized protein (UPF0335 family)
MKLTKLAPRKEVAAEPVVQVAVSKATPAKSAAVDTSGVKTGRTQTAEPNIGAKPQLAGLADKKAKLATLAATNLREFVTKNAELMEEFFALAEQYEELAADAKGAVKEEKRKDVLNFKMTGGAEKEVFTVDSLPPGVLTRRGVVKTVDNEVIETLLKAGALSPADAEATSRAKRTELTTISVSGPIGEFKITSLKKLLQG